FGQREPAGGWPAIAFVVIIVAMLASGVFSSDPEVDPAPGSALAPVGVAEGSGDGSAAVIDDQGEFVEFGFDSRFGVVTPRGESAGEVPAANYERPSQPERQM